MTDRGRPLARIEMLQGTLDLIILQTLRWGPRHGYGLAQLIQSTSRNVLQVNTGSLYPALHRLARRKLVEARWVKSESGQRVREYRLTEAGRGHLAVERDRWALLSDVMARILASPQEGEA